MMKGETKAKPVQARFVLRRKGRYLGFAVFVEFFFNLLIVSSLLFA